ncbi:MAG: DUF92 domain-containing protein, partial [Candidatus Ranarchaeia archaeon]
MLNFLNLIIGIIASCLIGFVGYKKKHLTLNAALVAIPIGIIHTGFGGISYMMMLFLFFSSSSLLSKYKSKEKNEIQNQFEKGSNRDVWQVLTNSIIPTIAILIDNFLFPNIIWFIISLANYTAKNADTWGTELGILSKGETYLITTLKEVPKGTAGGVSKLGTLAGLLGALFISLSITTIRLLALTLENINPLVAFLNLFWIIPVGAIGGFLGSMVDSFLASTVQQIYWCPKCMKETEQKIHNCGSETEYKRGLIKMNNDTVNFLSLLVAAVFS